MMCVSERKAGAAEKQPFFQKDPCRKKKLGMMPRQRLSLLSFEFFLLNLTLVAFFFSVCRLVAKCPLTTRHFQRPRRDTRRDTLPAARHSSLQRLLSFHSYSLIASNATSPRCRSLLPTFHHGYCSPHSPQRQNM